MRKQRLQRLAHHLRATGASMRRISDELSVPLGTVHRWLDDPKMKPKPRLAERRKAIEDMQRWGYDVPTIAEELQVSEKTVERHLERIGAIPNPPRPEGAYDPRRHEAYHLLEDGWTVPEVAKELGVSCVRVRRWMDSPL